MKYFVSVDLGRVLQETGSVLYMFAICYTAIDDRLCFKQVCCFTPTKCATLLASVARHAFTIRPCPHAINLH